jgi:hypothetical protein
MMAQSIQTEVRIGSEGADDLMAAEDHLRANRTHLRMTLDDMNAEVAVAMKEAGLSIEVLFMEPVGDEAVVNFATDLDPADRDWPQAQQIICGIVSSRVGIDGLWCRSVPCTAAGQPVGDADVAAVGDDQVRRITESS